MASKPRGIDSPAEEGFATLVGNGPSSGQSKVGGRPSYPMQTPSNALGTKIVEQHIVEAVQDNPSDPRKGSRGNVDRSVTSDAAIKTQ